MLLVSFIGWIVSYGDQPRIKKDRSNQKNEIVKSARYVIEDFDKNGILYYSEYVRVTGILFWVSNKPEWMTFIRQFEKKYKALVYHCELSYLEFGNCLTLLYVSDHKEEWNQDINDLKEGYALVYVWNIDNPECSELGNIMFKSVNGGIVRTA